MKCRTLLITFALTAVSISFSASANESSICSDPLKKVCTDTVGLRVQRDIYVNQLKQEISAEANKNAAPRIEEMKNKISKFNFIKRAIQSYKIRNQEIMKSAKVRISGIETVVTSPENIAKLKGYMSQAIDESNFDAATKASFKAIQASVVIGNFSDFLERTNMEDSFISQLLSNACGSDGLVENAFATTLKGQKYVLICPGFLISMSQDANPIERFNSILHAITHELAHHIDNSKVGNELYAPYLSCLAANYSDKFKRTKDDEKFCKKNEKDPAACSSQVVNSHAGELIADQWGIKVTALHAKKENYSFSDTDEMLTSSWNKLCGTSDEGIHPTGDFRIGTLMRTSPEILEILSCNNSEISRPACTLDGAVSL